MFYNNTYNPIVYIEKNKITTMFNIRHEIKQIEIIEISKKNDINIISQLVN